MMQEDAGVPKSVLPVTEDRFLGKHEVLRIAGFSAATLWREVNAGRFPAPISISANRKGFLESEVRAWIANRVATRRSTWIRRPAS